MQAPTAPDPAPWRCLMGGGGVSAGLRRRRLVFDTSRASVLRVLARNRSSVESEPCDALSGDICPKDKSPPAFPCGLRPSASPCAPPPTSCSPQYVQLPVYASLDACTPIVSTGCWTVRTRRLCWESPTQDASTTPIGRVIPTMVPSRAPLRSLGVCQGGSDFAVSLTPQKPRPSEALEGVDWEK